MVLKKKNYLQLGHRSTHHGESWTQLLGKKMDPLFSKHSSQESHLFSLQPGGRAASAQIAQMLTKNKPLLLLLHFWLMVIYDKTSFHATQPSTETASFKM